MMNRTALAALLLALASPTWATDAALQSMQSVSRGNLSAYDAGCTGGSCGAGASVCASETCRINRASSGALSTNNLVVAQSQTSRPAMTASVPAPELGADKEGSKDKPGFFSKLFSGKGLMYGLGGAAAGAGIGFLLGGPVGALIGGLLGGIGGFFLSKMLAK